MISAPRPEDTREKNDGFSGSSTSGAPSARPAPIAISVAEADDDVKIVVEPIIMEPGSGSGSGSGGQPRCPACTFGGKDFAVNVCSVVCAGSRFKPHVRPVLMAMLLSNVKTWYRIDTAFEGFGQTAQHPCVWHGLLASLVHSDLALRATVLKDVVSLLATSLPNRDAVLQLDNWQQLLVPLLFDLKSSSLERCGSDDSSFRLTLHILTQLLARSFMTSENFYLSLLSCVRMLQSHWEAAPSVSQEYARVLLRSLAIELHSNRNRMPNWNREHVSWSNLFDVVKAVRIFVFSTPSEAHANTTSTDHDDAALRSHSTTRMSPFVTSPRKLPSPKRAADDSVVSAPGHDRQGSVQLVRFGDM